MKFITIDTKADAVYVYVQGPFTKRLKWKKSKKMKQIYDKEVIINLDFDKEGKLLGVEIV